MKMFKIALITAVFSLALAACNQTTIARCPPLTTYSAGFQKQAAQELKAAGPKVKILVKDYGLLRDGCRIFNQ